jgi:DNA-binding LacI/PurR family transcriptional regulator
MGRWAVERLERRIDSVDGREGPVRHTIDCPIVARESIAPPIV